MTGERVLVIEDDPAARYLLQKSLTSPQCCVLEAPDGRSGLIAARRARPSMIILDLGLPDMSGEDVLDVLKADEQLGRVPVALITAATLTPAEKARLGARAQQVISKNEIGSDRWRELLLQGVH
jgi:CheY-like chemotaxis protein